MRLVRCESFERRSWHLRHPMSGKPSADLSHDSRHARMRAWSLVIVGVVFLLDGCREESIQTEATRGVPRAPGGIEARAAIIDSAGQPRRDSVVKFFAPIIYQEVNDIYDFLTRATFDDDWAGNDNWYHADAFPLQARVYVSLVEDQNRYFLHYGTFHPRDWCRGPG